MLAASSDGETDVRPVSLRYLLPLRLPAEEQIQTFPSKLHQLRSTQLLYDLRRAHTHTRAVSSHTHTRSIITYTHLSWSCCRTRGGEKRLEEFGPESQSRLQTAGKVQSMSVSPSPQLLPSLSVSVRVCLGLPCDGLSTVASVAVDESGSTFYHFKRSMNSSVRFLVLMLFCLYKDPVFTVFYPDVPVQRHFSVTAFIEKGSNEEIMMSFNSTIQLPQGARLPERNLPESVSSDQFQALKRERAESASEWWRRRPHARHSVCRYRTSILTCDESLSGWTVERSACPGGDARSFQGS